MSKPKWEDTTSYSHGDNDRVPGVWTMHVAQIRIIVHRHRDYGPDVWLVSVHGALDIRPTVLKAEDIDKAKREALRRVKTALRALVKEIP